MRTRTSPGRRLARRLARFNRDAANPVVRLIAGQLPPLAIVLHRGRTTGRSFATPVLAFRTPDGLVVAVLYGTVSDWVRNLQASGGGQVKRRGRIHSYRDPRLVSRDEALKLVPGALRVPFRALGVRRFLRLSLSTTDHAAD